MHDSKALRAAAKLWYVKTLDLRSGVPIPRDSHSSVSGADDPDRVLLIGNGHTHGWGTLTHELALTGQLARALGRATGRATDVDYVGDEMMSMSSVVPWLRETRLADYDLVLVVLSVNDAVRLTPVEEYRRDMTTLLDKLVDERSAAARIVVAGIYPIAAVPSYSGVLARMGQRSADRLNAAAHELVGRYDAVRFLDLPAPEAEPDRPHGSPGMYAEWSAAFCGACVPALEEARGLAPRRERATRTSRSWDWAPAERIVDAAPEEGWSGLTAIVRSAKKRLATDIAYVTVIDHEQQYFAATTGPNGRSVPLQLTHCDVTARGSVPVIVRNALQDERFGASPFIDVTQMRFYAGVPLRNATGRTIGTFCVASALPAGGRRFARSRLLEYAAAAQQELQRLGDELSEAG